MKNINRGIFGIRMCIDKKLKPLKDPKRKNDLVFKKPNSFFSKICDKERYSCNERDIIQALETKKIISYEEKVQLYNELYEKREFQNKLRKILGVRLAIGWRTGAKSGSYLQLCFPIGIPISTNRDKKTERLVNDEWISIYQKTANRKPNIVVQTSVELEHAEDLMAQLEVEMSLNEQARRQLVEYTILGAFSDPTFQIELEKCFNRTGWLIIKLVNVSPEVVTAYVYSKLTTRAVGIMIRFLNKRKSLIYEHNSNFPSTRAIYKTRTKIFTDFTQFNMISTPITFPVENLIYASMIVERYAKAQEDSKDNENILNLFKQGVSELRSVGGDSRIAVSANHAKFLVACALFCTYFTSVRDIERLQQKVKIPSEIGIIDDESLCVNTIITQIVDLIKNKKGKLKERFSSLAGMFPRVDLINAERLIKVSMLVLATTLDYFEESSASPIFNFEVNINSGILTVFNYGSTIPKEVNLSNIETVSVI